MLPGNTRLIGLLKLLAGSAGFALVFWVILTYGQEPGFGGIRGPVGPAVAAGLPGAFALVGFIELTTGMRFGRLADAWDAMSAWKRGLLGTFIVFLALAATSGIFLALALSGLI